ncbi:MAG: PAS domain-containing protein [Candidatus Rokubacteria bacterium]|nr:PAS domain-containing protein [Candidatus Rokubacteria bacterium]
MKIRLTLRSREVLAITTVVLLVVAVATGAHLASVARITLRAAADEGELLARQLFHQSSRVIAAARPPSTTVLGRDPGIRALLEGMVGYSHTVVYAAIVDPAGRVAVHSDPSREGTPLPPRESLATVRAWGTLRMIGAMLGEPRVYEAQLPMQLGARPFGTVRVGISTSLLRRELIDALLRGLTLAAAALVVAVAVGLGAGRPLLRSLRRIAQGMERLARGEYGAAVDLTRDDELGELAARVNRLGERIQADQSQWQSEKAQMEGIINTLEDAVVVLNRNRQVIFCNQAAAELLGRPMEEMLNQPLEAFLPAQHALLPVVEGLFEVGQECRNVPMKVPCRDGPTRELAASSYRIREGGQAGGGVLALKDLDPVRAVQSLVTYSQKLAALGRLTSGVAHELKNPLNAMRIHLELVKTRLKAGQPEVGENLDVIAREIQQLDRVVQGFLKFARPQDLRLAPVDMNAVLTEVARLTAPEAAQSGAQIILDPAPHLPRAMGDAELLQQACTNLVTNAIQAMPRGGTVTLATRLLPQGVIEVRVSDEGVGIPPEEIEKIFRLYYTTKSDGSGIGLSLVYRIVQLHDGRIDVESTVGRGTTVILTLPITQARAVA